LPYELLPLCVDSQPHGNLEETLRITTKGVMVMIFVILALIIIKEFLLLPKNSRAAMLARMERLRTENPLYHHHATSNKDGKHASTSAKNHPKSAHHHS